MADYDLIVRNGLLVSETGVRRCDVAVADGMIAAVGRDLSSAAVEIDASRLHVFPGGVDVHVHFNEPGRTDWEGIRTGTSALAAGGTTVFFDMPLNSDPVTIDAETFDDKVQAAQASAVVDFGLWGGLVPGNLGRLEELARRGAVGFKAFMCYSGIEEFPAADDFTLLEGMRICRQLGAIVAVHAENQQLVHALAAQARAAGRHAIRDYIKSRPAVAELEALSRAVLFAEETGCALHVVHVSTGRAVALIAAARRRGVDVSCETCPHYLVLTEDDAEELGALAKCAPPLRDAAAQEDLWTRLLAGEVELVSSDHSPGPPDLKRGEDMFKVWGGMSGCQSTLQLLLSHGYKERGLELYRLVGLISRAPAARFRLEQKGSLEVGKDADLALIDLEPEWDLNLDELLYQHQQSAFVGRRVKGRVRRTLVRGTTVYDQGEVTALPAGRLVTPARPRRPDGSDGRVPNA